MAHWDVAGRLAEGRPAVQHTQTYVRACQVRGYQHPDLTAHGAQVWDWYDTEDGLNLQVLEDDSTALWAAVAATEQALATQRAQLAELCAAWQGAGADCAVRFLQQHCEAAAAVSARVRAAAEGYAALCDTLWRLVDGKAATAIAVDDRRLADRPEWLAAAHAVTTGVGDRSADDVIAHQVMPYVDNDIRVDWLTAMRSTAASVDASLDAVIDGLAALPDGCFEVMGDLGPRAPTAVAPAISMPTGPIPTVPAATAPPPPPPSPSPPPPLPPTSPPPPATAPLGEGIGMPGGMGDLGGAGVLSGIGGVVGSIIDGISGLLGSLGDPGTADAGLGDATAADPFDEEADEGEELTDDEDPTDADEEEPAAPDESLTATEDVVETPTEPEEQPLAEPVAQSPPPAAAPAPPDEKTPCEIAAEELPQAGQ